MNFHETIMGKRFFEHQLPQLIKTLQDISANQSRPAAVIKLPVEPPAQDFLETLYQQSAVFEPVGMLRQYTQAAAKAQKGFFRPCPLKAGKHLMTTRRLQRSGAKN